MARGHFSQHQTGCLGAVNGLPEECATLRLKSAINWIMSRCCYPLNHLTLFLSYQPRCKQEETGWGKEG
ncbi:hypothetical protein Q8A67_024179 [Cirrhinus molitorella]|uniref:Uncharacterized protein n=1 Tax=Cirrhinus molitorella TaxID=172907 RepID=A0AA88P3Y4_9TELE|nr:hypothetical protein Q8A67_024179 [Cirrhinus molitorella]